MALGPANADIDVINLALVRLGHPTIVDIDENTEAAILARATYDTLRRGLLEQHPWNFATRYATLSAGTLPTAAAMRYDYAFDLPTDALRILECEGQSADDGDEWEVSNGQILTNLGGDTLRIRYIYNHTTVSQWSSRFVDVLAAKLEHQWAEHLVKETSLAERKLSDYETVLGRARTIDSAQATPRKLDASTWIKAR